MPVAQRSRCKATVDTKVLYWTSASVSHFILSFNKNIEQRHFPGFVAIPLFKLWYYQYKSHCQVVNPSYCNQKPAYALGEVDELTMGLTSACTKSAFRSPPPPPPPEMDILSLGFPLSFLVMITTLPPAPLPPGADLCAFLFKHWPGWPVQR